MSPKSLNTLCDMIDLARIKLDDLREVTDLQGSNLEILQEAAEGTDESALLWTDNELILYANQAVAEVAERANVVGDRGTIDGLTRFSVLAGATDFIALSDRFISVRRVYWDGKPIGRAYEDRLASEYSDWQARTGTPHSFVLDTTTREIRPFPAPEQDGTLTLDVITRPLTDMADMDDVPPIPVRLREGAINWICHLAYLKNDADTHDPQKAERFEALFARQFGDRPSANTLECRFDQAQRHRPRLVWF